MLIVLISATKFDPPGEIRLEQGASLHQQFVLHTS
jgi:hypothetical protein